MKSRIIFTALVIKCFLQITIILEHHLNFFTSDKKCFGSWKEVFGPTGAKFFLLKILRPTSGVIANNESYGYYFEGLINRLH